MKMRHGKLEKRRTGLLVIDVQEKLLPHENRSEETLRNILKVIEGFQILTLPIFVTEQYPKGLGQTVEGIRCLLGSSQSYLVKSTFSCLADSLIKERLKASDLDQWVLVGIEAHVCVLQTAKDLLTEGYQVVVLNDAITSRSAGDFLTAVSEMRECGIRISSCETVLFELLQDCLVPEFKKISQLIK